MSKSNIRKITVDPTKCNTDSRRPSVFERLGTKPAVTATGQNTSDYCRNWALNGSCSYGKNCKYANTHTLISPSKRAKKDNAISNTTGLVEDPFKRLTSKIVKKPSHSPDLNLEEWNQTDLEYEDEKVLERRRQLLQRELEIQMKKDKEVHGKEKVRQKKKAMSSSSSSRTSSTSSSSSSSSSEDSSSSSTSDSRKKVKKMKLKRHHSASTDYDEEKERRRKLKIKRLGTKNEKPVTKKKRKIDAGSIKKDISVRTNKKCASTSSSSRKHSTGSRVRSPTVQVSSSAVASTPPTLLGSSVSVAHHLPSNKTRERNRSDSPKIIKGRESEKDDRHYKKLRDTDDVPSKENIKNKSFEKLKEQDKEKNRTLDEKMKTDDRLKAKCKEKDVRSRTPSISERTKHQYNKETVSTKSRRSRTPEKPSRSKREVTPSRNQERLSSSSRSRDVEKKDRENHKNDKNKDREEIRKSEQGKQRQSSSQDEAHRKNVNKDFDEKSYLNDKTRQKSRECRDKDHARDERNHTRFSRDQRDPQRDKEKDDTQERCRERQRDRDRERDRERERERDRDRERDRERERERDRERDRDRDRERDRDKEPIKTRDRDVSSLVPSASISLTADKNSRYARDKERIAGKESAYEKASTRDRRSDRERERSETKALNERDRTSSQRFDTRYDRNGADKDALNRKATNSPRDRVDRFPRERSLDKVPLLEKTVHPPSTASSVPLLPPVPPSTTSSSSAVAITPALSASRDHLIDRVDSAHYERDRHRRFSTRYERGHGSEHDRKESRVTPTKIDRVVERRDASPRRAIEIERSFNRNYGRLGADHWEDQEESNPHLDYRDHHAHEDDRRKIIDGRRYESPFDERRGIREERSRDSRYVVQTGDRPSFDDHRHHHHHHRHPIYSGEKLRSGGSALRDEAVPNDDWEAHHREVEHGRDRSYTAVDWEEREWRARALWGSRDSLPRSEAHDDEWAARYENSLSDWKANENRKWDNQAVHIRGHYRNERSKEVELGESTSHNKRRPYTNPEVREECPVHTSKQVSLYGSMKEEPINKKLMELAEGRLHTNREKSVEIYQKKNAPKEKSEVKETHLPEPKRSCIEESLQTLHTESDLSDISDDPDDILNMEEEITDAESNKLRLTKKTPDIAQKEQQSITQETTQPSPKESIEDTVFNAKGKDNTVTMAFRNMDDENMETMDFEEISDGELEEDIKTSGKGLGDALGVDWESFVKEMQPRRPLSSGQHNAENRWQCKAIFHRIGISFKYAGEDTINKFSQKYGKEDHTDLFLDNVALVHTALTRNEFLRNLSNNLLPSMDDLVYRHENTSNDDLEYDIEALKPCTTLYETAKCLLQQVI
uniref:zinc finger CCCH domain-containing protein 13-like n=1 Tax=Vespula vulgaris TaxID=7454 RepID=UPI0021392C0B|nr:zinc finger CCCH domain-containing protein 13-like [Vespula vulgaris]